ncbi:MAG: hypothetical protein MK116_10900 [Phycisphaerales bacterium]|nr:hypothetical protein [Phycisphaerales bacterium]
MTKNVFTTSRTLRCVPVLIPLAFTAAALAQDANPLAQPIPAAPAASVTPTAAAPRSQPALSQPASPFDGYDFEHVVDTLQSSVNPLATEMNASFVVFVDEVDRAVTLMEEGRTREAVEASVIAIDGVLDVRDAVLEPMWDAQSELTAQIAEVRSRLARAVARNGSQPATSEAGFSPTTERLLDGVAARIAETNDPIRKKRLVAHYRTIRSLARVKHAAERMSPDQRRLWTNILTVLEQAALAHQQVLMGSEILFAQFEATAGQLREYLSLMQTIDGVNDLLGAVNGVGDGASGMASFVEGMRGLQEQLSGFNGIVEEALNESMFELEANVDAIQPVDGDDMQGVVSTSIDDELAARIERVDN